MKAQSFSLRYPKITRGFFISSSRLTSPESLVFQSMSFISGTTWSSSGSSFASAAVPKSATSPRNNARHVGLLVVPR